MYPYSLLKEGVGKTQLTAPYFIDNKYYEICFEINGNINGPIYFILGGISASKHVASSSFNFKKGWWGNIVGENKAINLNKCCVISIDYLDFEGVTTFDQAKAIIFLLDYLKIKKINSFIGYSYGGMVALSFASISQKLANKIIILGAASESLPQSYALRCIQQKIVELSIGTKNEKEALETARKLGIITYRSTEELNTRFLNDTNPIVNYLDKKGKEFSSNFSSQKFLTLSKSINNHKVNPFIIKENDIIFIGCTSDQITPFTQIQKLSYELNVKNKVYEIDSIYGHDAYLNETLKISNLFQTIFQEQKNLKEEKNAN
ncbi:alpha/beta fold hydrolase [Silvanigrella sp.]|jgi:homoserine O-acetyltransferase|uniref:alpha/beta fold hydrolase n=1 Tax=Silvanigrella sp. TaxID=2024976 RepID=UPI0037CA7175